MASVNESDQFDTEPNVVSHRVVTKEKLASHMSEVCKKKIDAFQAKFTNKKRNNNNSGIVQKRGPARKKKPHRTTDKLKKIRQNFLKHNRNITKQRAQAVSSDPKGIDIDSSEEAIATVDNELMDVSEAIQESKSYNEEGQLAWDYGDAIIKTEEDESWNYDNSLKDPLAMPEKEDPWKCFATKKHTDSYTNEKSEMIQIKNSDSDPEKYFKDYPSVIDEKGSDNDEDSGKSFLEDSDSINEKNSNNEEDSMFTVFHSLAKEKIQKKMKYCVHCGFSAKSLSNLRNHMRLQHMSKSLKLSYTDSHKINDDKTPYFGCCFHCSFSTYNPYILKNHMLIYHKNSTPSKCLHCNYSTFFSQEFNLHLMSVHSDYYQSEKVDYLDYGNNNNNKILQHFTSDTNEDVIKISNYSEIRINSPEYVETSGQEQNLNKQNEKNSMVFCSYCQFSTNEPQKIINHLTVGHKNKFSPPPPPQLLVLNEKDSDQNIFKCTRCNYKVSSLSKLSIHLYHHYDHYQCTVCYFTTKVLLHLEHHIAVLHTRTESSVIFCLYCTFSNNDSKIVVEHIKHEHEMPGSSASVRECPYCFYSSNAHNDYIHHIAYKHILKIPIKCDYCEFIACDHKKLAHHISVKRKMRREFFCYLCHFSSNLSGNFKKHLLKKHDEERKIEKPNLLPTQPLDLENEGNHLCIHCNYKVSDLEDFSKHLMDHNTSFFCSVCPFATKLNLHLLEHIIDSHTRRELSEIFCAHCSFKASEAETVIEHVKNDHEMNVYAEKVSECPYCFYTSTEHDEFVHHLAFKHASKVPIKCYFCNFVASTHSQLIEHVTLERNKRLQFYCHLCHFSTDIPRKFRKHFLHEHKRQGKQLACTFCVYRTRVLKNLIFHFECAHADLLQLPKDSENDIDTNETTDIVMVDSSSNEDDDSTMQHKEADHGTKHLQESNILSNPMFEYRLVCDKCNRVASNIEELERHIRNEHEGMAEVTFQCDYFALNESINLYKYMKTGTKGETYFDCPHCENSSEKIEQFQHHLKSKHKKKEIFHCPHCSSTFSDLEDLSEHSLAKHNFQFSFSCFYCHYKTFQAKEYKEHLHSEHDKSDVSSDCAPEDQLNDNVEGNEITYQCLYCSHSTYSSRDLLVHMKTDHKGLRAFPCHYCDYYCALFKDLEKHIKENHPSIKKMVCTECNFKTWSSGVFSEHLSLEHDIKFSFDCVHCHYKTYDSTKLQKHMKTDHLEQINTGELEISFSCSLCNNVFSDLDVLQEHITTDHINTDNPCPYCSYTTNKRPNLSFHISTIHKNGVDVCSCLSCDYSCNDYSELLLHMREHKKDGSVTNETRETVPQKITDTIAGSDDEHSSVELIFSCSFCEFSTDSSSDLTKHENSHANKEDSSSSQELSDVYMNNQIENENVLDETPIQFCSFCDFGVENPQELIEHCEKEHAEHGTLSLNLKKQLNKQFQQIIFSQRHENTESVAKNNMSISCSIDGCHFETTLLGDLIEHRRTQHLQNCAPTSSKTPKSIVVNRAKTVILNGGTILNKAKINVSNGMQPLGVPVKLLFPGKRSPHTTRSVNNQDKRKELNPTSNKALAFNRKNVANKVSEQNRFEFSCRQCNFTTNCYKDLQKHSLIHHKKSKTPISLLRKPVPIPKNNPPANQIFKCEHCHYTTKWAQNLMYHKLNEHA